jgi:hypothetical protein
MKAVVIFFNMIIGLCGLDGKLPPRRCFLLTLFFFSFFLSFIIQDITVVCAAMCAAPLALRTRPFFQICMTSDLCASASAATKSLRNPESQASRPMAAMKISMYVSALLPFLS